MKILVLNAGSSSVKFELIETSSEQIEANQDRSLAEGSIEKIGTSDALVSYAVAGAAGNKFQREILEHQQAVKIAIDLMTGNTHGVIRGAAEIEGVGHRVVHGGEQFSTSALMDDEVVRQIESSIELAPLHNPHNLKGYRAAQAILPQSKHVAVFDTAFHQTLPPRAYLYGLPYVVYTRHRIRRYGFHGTSHRYVRYRYGQIHKVASSEVKLITCHLGNGCSVCAVDHGKSVDTSMGFTPLEGLMMGTRTGDVDPAAVLHVMEKEGLRFEEISSLLNKHSGLYGVSGISNDMRTLLQHREQGNERAATAIDVFCYRVKKYFGAYLAALNGAEAIVFTGGIGENAPAIRAQICEQLDALGIVIDAQRNESAVGKEQEISGEGSAVKVWVIPTDEELLIARDTLRCILNLPHQY
jgi:acetate kinase